MARALMIGPAERAAIATLRDYAAAHPFSLEDVKARTAGVGYEFTLELPVGFRVAYTHEHQPMGLCRHISISVDRPGKGPHPYAVALLLNEFGFRTTAGAAPEEALTLIGEAAARGELHAYVEEADHAAINVIEKVDA